MTEHKTQRHFPFAGYRVWFKFGNKRSWVMFGFATPKLHTYSTLEEAERAGSQYLAERWHLLAPKHTDATMLVLPVGQQPEGEESLYIVV